MRTNKETKARIKKLTKERERFCDMKLKFLLGGMRTSVQYAEEDIRGIEGEIRGLEWAIGKTETHFR